MDFNGKEKIRKALKQYGEITFDIVPNNGGDWYTKNFTDKNHYEFVISEIEDLEHENEVYF